MIKIQVVDQGSSEIIQRRDVEDATPGLNKEKAKMCQTSAKQ